MCYARAYRKEYATPSVYLFFCIRLQLSSSSAYINITQQSQVSRDEKVDLMILTLRRHHNKTDKRHESLVINLILNNNRFYVNALLFACMLVWAIDILENIL